MKPSIHVFFGIICARFIFLLFPKIGVIGFLLIFFSSFLIDADHYLYYVGKKKDFNLIVSYRLWTKKRAIFNKRFSWKEKKKHYGGIFIFHGIEWVIILVLFSYFWIYFLYVGIGIAIHLLLDVVECYFIKIGRADRFSLLWDVYKSRKLRYFEYQKL